ncbi:hypothetical protein IMZ48_04925 [Candidatus Bathyarchaeota archaeon]|nr:hypothetical protein [Candidatus Bathyarchaeota archaeon]
MSPQQLGPLIHASVNLTKDSVDDHLRSVACMPAYFARYGLREPSTQLNTVYSFAAGDPSLTVWEHMGRDPARMKKVMASMAAMATLMPTVGSYDFGWVVEVGKEEPGRTLVMDVGGGRGHALAAIADATPGLDLERCVVGDLAPVVDEARGLARGALQKAKFVAMDFHNKQPVKGTHPSYTYPYIPR